MGARERCGQKKATNVVARRKAHSPPSCRHVQEVGHHIDNPLITASQPARRKDALGISNWPPARRQGRHGAMQALSPPRAARCVRKPHPRKSRTAEIPTSGSGEGPGRVTGLGYSTTKRIRTGHSPCRYLKQLTTGSGVETRSKSNAGVGS